MNVKNKVIVVDDDMDYLNVLCDGISSDLAPHDIEVVRFYSSEDATNYLRSRSSEVFCVVTDLQMPDRHGYGVIREVFELSRSIKVIVASGSIAPIHYKRCEEMGVTQFIEKPVYSSVKVSSKILEIYNDLKEWQEKRNAV